MIKEKRESMKKILLFLLIFLIIIGISVELLTGMINEIITKEDLPEVVYQDTINPYNEAQNALEDFFNFGVEDDYTVLELFMNYMIYDSIKENINASYDPLSECEDDECRYIFTHSQGRVDYVYASLNDVNQMVITLSIKRDAYPDLATAIHLIFDVETSMFGTSFTLTLDEAKLADRTISKSTLDTLFNYLDKDTIESSITYGELNLDDYTFTVSLLNI